MLKTHSNIIRFYLLNRVGASINCEYIIGGFFQLQKHMVNHDEQGLKS